MRTTPDGAVGVWSSHCYWPCLWDYVMVALGMAIVAFFALGLRTHRHCWKPLVLGLFSLGIGLFWATLRLEVSFQLVASGHDAHLQTIAAFIVEALSPAKWGLAFCLVGGFFTLILHWRNRRFAEPQAIKHD
jgi:hypothetical protein